MIDTASSARVRWIAKTVTLSGGFVLFFAVLRLGRNFEAHSLDASWSLALSEAFKQGLDCGIDYVFTYGPLGYLLDPNSRFDPELFYAFTALQCLSALIITGVLVSAARRLASTWEQVAFLSVAALFSAMNGTSPRMLLAPAAVVLALEVVAPRGTQRRPPFLVYALLLFLALSSLGKFTLFLMSSLAALIIVLAWLRFNRRHSFWMAAFYAVSLLTIWMASGQELASIPHFLSRSLEIASAYSEGMSRFDKTVELRWALLTLGLLGSILALKASHQWRDGTKLFVVLMLAGSVFMAWKQGFVRQDAHTRMFFAFAGTVPFLATVDLQASQLCKLGMRSLRYLTVLAASAGFFSLGNPSEDTAYRLAAGVPRRIVVANFKGLLDLGGVKEARGNRRAKLAATLQLPKIREAVGNRPIDVFTGEHVYLFANGLRWTPRPVLQSYATLTDSLLRLNGEFMAGATAPKFVLLNLRTIDRRLPMMEDSQALLLLLTKYRPVMREREFLLLKRRRRAGQGQVDRLGLVDRTFSLEETLDLREFAKRDYVATLRLQPNLSGRLMRLLYRLPPVWLDLWTVKGRRVRYRILPSMVSTEFLLNPLIETTEHVEAWYSGASLPVLKSLRVSLRDRTVADNPGPSRGTAYFEPEFEIRIYEFAHRDQRRRPPSRPERRRVEVLGAGGGTR